MTSEQQRIAISEACGVQTTRLTIFGEKVPRYIGDLPDYLSDLNAMHKAWLTLNAQQRSDWWSIICEVVYSQTPLNERSIMVVANATAPQRAEAFLRTIGKWVEE